MEVIKRIRVYLGRCGYTAVRKETGALRQVERNEDTNKDGGANMMTDVCGTCEVPDCGDCVHNQKKDVSLG